MTKKILKQKTTACDATSETASNHFPDGIYIACQKDLGENTEEIAKGMKICDPDSSWKKFEGESPQK